MPIIACPVIILARVHSRLTSFFCLFHWGNRQFRKIPMSFCWVATELFHWLWASLSSAGPPAKLLSTVPVELPGWSSMWPGQWLHPRKDSERSSQRPQFGRGGFSTYEFLRKNDHDRAPSEPVRISEHNFPIWSYVLYYVFLRYIFYGAPMQFHLPPSVDRLCRDIGITTVVLILAWQAASGVHWLHNTEGGIGEENKNRTLNWITVQSSHEPWKPTGIMR